MLATNHFLVAILSIAICRAQLLTFPFSGQDSSSLTDLFSAQDEPMKSSRQPLRGALKVTSSNSSLCDPSVVQHAGYFEIADSDKRYFFWFFEARESPESRPTVAWLTGGPGCSSMLALLGENGPCTLDPTGSSTIRNPFSWNSRANMIWVDQPPGAGFSEGSADSGEDEVAQDMVGFLVAFFEAFPQYNRDFYLFGESYAGHYIPAIAARIRSYNKEASARVIDMKGVGIGNGLTAPSEQYKWYPLMAFNSTTAPQVVSESEYKKMQASVGMCTRLIELCNAFEGKNPSCLTALLYCNINLMKPYQDHGMNPYDMRVKCEHPPLCYDFSRIDKFLNSPTVQEQLGVTTPWESCNMQVNMQFAFDFMRDYDMLLPPLLEDGIKVLVYVGDQDFICNWIGNKKWVMNLEWSGKTKFNTERDAPYKTDTGEEVGMMRSFGGLSFLQVFQAGHMVPMDQPERSLFMFNDFIGVGVAQLDVGLEELPVLEDE